LSSPYFAEVVGKIANASLHRPQARPDRQYAAETTTQTFMAGTYAKTAERGCGHVQAFVSAFSLPTLPLLLSSFSPLLNQDMIHYATQGMLLEKRETCYVHHSCNVFF